MFFKTPLAWLIGISVLLTGCASKFEPQDGTLKFTLLGKQYGFEHQCLTIGPQLSVSERFEGRQVRPLRDDHKVDFRIVDTEQAANALAESIKNHQHPATFVLEWDAESADPEALVASQPKFSLGNVNPKVDHMVCYPILPDINMFSREDNNCWIKIDEFTNGRIKGRFGVTCSLSTGPGSLNPETAEVSDGTFDLPYVKLFK